MEVLIPLLLADLGEVAVSDADVVLRQLVVSVGGICGGGALLYAIINVRSRVVNAWVIARLLIAMSILSLLTTEHIYSHLKAGTAPAWQLWSALFGFGLGAESLGRRIKNHKVTVVKPEKKAVADKDVKPPPEVSE